jgi:hypothetical protein
MCWYHRNTALFVSVLQVGKKKPKYVYKTAQEIIQSGVGKKKSLPSKASKVKVIDMTGKEKRVLSGIACDACLLTYLYDLQI